MEIPQDIIDNVIAAIGYDKRSLKQCTLVSSSFLLPSRKQLFSKITLRSDQTCQGIHQFLLQNPIIQPFVRSITLKDSWGYKIPNWMNGPSLLAILRLPFCCLECFSIIVRRNDWNEDPWDWNSFSSELKDALTNIIHSSTLETLNLAGITKVPITIFLHIAHLTTLELHSLSPNDFGGENPSSLTQASSKGVAASMASHSLPVIDRCVWHFWEYVRGPTEPIFLPFLCRLRFFKIYIELGSTTTYDFDTLYFLMDSLFISLKSPATLEHLEFNIRFRDCLNPSDFEPYRFYNNLRHADVWSHLDSITTHPTGLRLQRVDININYCFSYDDDVEDADEGEVEKAVLDGLPLLCTKGILFVEAVLGD